MRKRERDKREREWVSEKEIRERERERFYKGVMPNWVMKKEGLESFFYL